MKVFVIPKGKCPGCGFALDGATNVFEAARPRPGDATMCLHCGIVSVFTADLRLRVPTARELAALSNDPRMQAMARAHTKARGGTKQ